MATTAVTGAPVAPPPEKADNESPARLAGFDFSRMDDHSGKLEVITALVDTAIDHSSDAVRMGNILYAALWLLEEQYPKFNSIHDDLLRLKIAEVGHA